MSSSTLSENVLQNDEDIPVNCYENHLGLFGPTNVPEYPFEITDKAWDAEIFDMDSPREIVALVRNII